MHVSLHFSPAGLGWKLSQFGRELSCLAICEFVENPEHVKRHTKGKPRIKPKWDQSLRVLIALPFQM